MDILFANHNLHKIIPACVGPISLPAIAASISCDILHQLLIFFCIDYPETPKRSKVIQIFYRVPAYKV